MKDRNERHEPHTIGGETRLVPVREPEPPTDWDLIATRFVIGVVGLFTIGTMIWSTVAISKLLMDISTLWAAIIASVLFDLAWIWSKVVGLLGRFEPERVKSVKRAGVLFLLIAMGLIVAEGFKSGHPLIGVAGACVSLVAWKLWDIAEQFFAIELGEKDTAFLTQARRELQVQMAVQLNQRVIGRYATRLAALASANQHDASVLSFQTLPYTRTDTRTLPRTRTRTLPYTRTDTDGHGHGHGHTDTDTSGRTHGHGHTDTDIVLKSADTDTDMSGSVRTDGQTVSVPCTTSSQRVTQLWTPAGDGHQLLSRKREGSLSHFVLAQILAGYSDEEIRGLVGSHLIFRSTKREYLTRLLRQSRGELEQHP